MKDRIDKAHLVRFKPKQGRKPTAKEKAQLAALAKLPDDQIDTSEAPELPISRWKNEGVVGKLYRPIKRPVTMRLDADVIEWLRTKAAATGTGYQTTANTLLRSQMNEDLSPSK
jgi:uncharacterized protein (DUF4415 family)